MAAVDASLLQGTDFADVISVFSGAWTRIRRALDSALQYNVGVLLGTRFSTFHTSIAHETRSLDLHAAPGKQNADAHSGQCGSVRFYDKFNLRKTQDTLSALAKELKDTPNLVGIQILNEPQNDNRLADWYSSTIDILRNIAPGVPFYIHDAWDTNYYSSFAGSRSEFVVVDHHLYRCFTAQDQASSGEEHGEVLRNRTTGEFAAHSRSCHGNIVVAEFSAALNPSSMRSNEPGEQDRQRRVFARAQLEMFEQHCAGWYFWTYKKLGWDAGWCFRNAMQAEILPQTFGIQKSSALTELSSEARQDGVSVASGKSRY